MIGNKISDKITKLSKNSQQNNSETVANENYKEIPKERYVSIEDRQKIIDEMRSINLLDNTPNQPTKFRTKNWVEINDDTRGTYNTNSQTKFKTSMLMSSLCDYSDAYMVVTGTTTVTEVVAAGGNIQYAIYNIQYTIVLKNCAPFTDCVCETNNTQVDNAKDIDA